MKKQIQFELWPDCNSGCEFCYLCNRKTSYEFKMKAIKYAYNKLFNVNNTEFDTVGFIGGEFFQGQLQNELKKEFKKLILLCNELLSKNYINNLWLSASLIIGDQSDLHEILHVLSNNLHKVWILSSFDTIGRFKNSNRMTNWKTNMTNLSKMFPDINLNVTMILTKDLMNKYIEDKIDFKEFRQQYKTTLYFKAPDLQREKYNDNVSMNKNLPSFFPDRSTTIKFFNKLRKEDKESWDKLFDINYRADILIKNINEEVIRDKTTYNELYNNENHIMKCGHFYAYNSYEKEDGCILCDKLKIDEIGADNE